MDNVSDFKFHLLLNRFYLLTIPSYSCRAEIGVIASDIPEVLGTAYALLLLFRIPLVLGVIITAADTLLFLMLQYASIRLLEMLVGFFLMVVSCCFIVEFFWAGISVVEMIEGFIPFYGVTEGQGRSVIHHSE